MQSEQDAREIAEKLTKAQRDALLGVPADMKWTACHPVSDTMLRTLHARGLIIFKRNSSSIFASKYLAGFTDLGRSVASHLQRKSPS